MGRTTVLVDAKTRDRLTEVRKALAAARQRPLGHITHDAAITWLLDHADVRDDSEGQVDP